MEGIIFEYSDSVNAYRAEQLGVCAVHAALSIFYGITDQECIVATLEQSMFQGDV